MITAESYLVGDFSMETPFSFGGCVPKAKNQDYVRDEYGVNEDELDQVEVRNDAQVMKLIQGGGEDH